MEPQQKKTPKEKPKAVTSLPDKLPSWLEDMPEANEESYSYEYDSDMNADLPSRLFPQETDYSDLGDGFIKISRGHEIRHGRRASHGAIRSLSRERPTRKGLLSKSADSSRRSSDYVEKRRHGNNHNVEQHLEQSWSSLSFFNQTQRGRLSAVSSVNATISSTPEILEADLLSRTSRMMGRLQTADESDSELIIEGHSLFARNEQLYKQDEIEEEFLMRKYSPSNNHMEDLISIQSDDFCSLDSSNVSAYDASSPDTMIYKPPISFCIPELPSGKYFELVIMDTWGDPHYVGLNGLEVFASTGLPAEIVSVSADPADINTLTGYSGDPRVVSNLVDGINLTRDDMHMWLAPFTPGKEHRVKLEFNEIITIALIRVWNYNKSRVHSYRGARLVEMILDGVTVFRGEIARACGGDKGAPPAFGDTILFTTRDDILENVSVHDKCFALLGSADNLLESPSSRQLPYEAGTERPFTHARGLSVFNQNPSNLYDPEPCQS